jgi:hypothetical protein
LLLLRTPEGAGGKNLGFLLFHSCGYGSCALDVLGDGQQRPAAVGIVLLNAGGVSPRLAFNAGRPMYAASTRKAVITFPGLADTPEDAVECPGLRPATAS